MSSNVNVDVSLWNLYCFSETWGYTFKPPTRKMTIKSHGVSEKSISFICDLLIFNSRSFSYEFGNLLNYFWRNDLSFFPLPIKLFGHLNLSILRISSCFKWQFWWIPKLYQYSLLFWVGQMKHQNFHWVEDLVAVFYF